MAQIEKLIARLLSYPTDFTWEELIKILSHFGFKELEKGKTGGSRRKFTDNEKHVISLHEPHPGKILKLYQLKDTVKFLQERGYLHE